MAILVSIAGPTGVGKTQLAIQLAHKYQTEILSCDSRQIYRELSIGTAKPSLTEREGIPHHLMDFLDLDQAYSAGQFERDAQTLLSRIFSSKAIAFAVGGSTLYFDALWYGMNDMPIISPEIRQQLIREWKEQGLSHLLKELEAQDPKSYQNIDRDNPVRVIRALEVWRGSNKPLSYYQERPKKKSRQTPYQHLKIGLYRDRALLYERINKRVDQMITMGVEEEVRTILDKGHHPGLQALQSIGYKEWIDHFQGKYDREEAIRLIKRNSRRYAKRQLTYFRRYQDLHWFDAADPEETLKWITNEIEKGKQ